MRHMITYPKDFPASSLPCRTSAQSGFVLVIALIVLVAMTLAAAAMVRTVDTSTLLARNISFKRDAVNRADFALEAAINQFRVGGSFPGGQNTRNSAPLKNFSAVMLPTDSDGVPTVLKANPSSLTFTGGDLGEAGLTMIPSALLLNMKPVYLIERMCTVEGGAALTETCIVDGRAQAGGSQPSDRPPQLFPPLFRITARVTGPRNTVSYVQAIFSFKNI